jgi:hypothetical protein
MPIEFAPPTPNLQGYQITPPQSTDPLQTLAQMGQLRTQGLQQQSAQLQLEQERQKLDSSKGLMDAMLNGQGDFEKTFRLATQPGSKVLPADLIGLRQHYTQMQQEAAALDKTTRENTAAGIDQYRGLLANVKTPDDLAAANAQADQLGIPKTVPRHTQFSDPTHVQAFSNGLAAQSQLMKEATERETQAKERAQAGLAGVQTTEAQQKVDAGEQAAAVRELQAAPTDPATGTPTPAAMAAIHQAHPKVVLPQGTKDDFDRFYRSVVPTEKQPEYDINAVKAKLGLMGNTEFDQYQLRYAQSIGKKPSELTFAEMQKVLQQYAKDKQTPELLEAILSLKASQGTLAKAQVAAMPTDAELEAEARDYRNLDMPPSRLAAMREGRIQYFPQLLEKARAQAAAEGKPFSPADLEQRYDVRTETEKAFTGDGAQAQKISGFENLMRHTGLLWKANDALAKNDFPLMRQIANAVGSKVGSDAKTTYDMIATFVSDEAAKTFLPGGGGEGERAKTLAHVSSDLGAAQTKTNLKNLMELADSQRQTLERQYAEGTFGKGTRRGRLFSPDALANRDLVMGKKPAAAAAPGQQQQLQYVKRAVGPNNHAIGQTSDGKWHDIRTGAVIQ